MSRLHPYMVPGVIIVDGPIGAGKTTFIEHLRSELTQAGATVAVIDEVIPEDLAEYYKDPATQSYPFQCRFISILAESLYNLSKEIERGGADFVISDRYYASTRAFIEYQRSKGYLTDEQVNDLYNKIRLVFRAIPIVPEYFIYIDEPAEVCIERILGRGREGELLAKREALMATNDFIRRFNSVPYFGFGEDSYCSLERLGRVHKYLAEDHELAQAVGRVKLIHLYCVEEGTTKGIVLPHKQPAQLSELLLQGKTLRHLRDQIARDAILLVTTGLNPDDIHSSELDEKPPQI